MPNFGV